MSCAWNNYCIAVKNKMEATKVMKYMGDSLLKSNPEDPVLIMLNEMLGDTSTYYFMDGLIFERDNYITLIEDDMERNGDVWIYYLAGTIRDKATFDWLKSKGTFRDIKRTEIEKLPGFGFLREAKKTLLELEHSLIFLNGLCATDNQEDYFKINTTKDIMGVENLLRLGKFRADVVRYKGRVGWDIAGRGA